ncbi:MAG: putative rane protein [Phycisphaerales bacterium]|nr:putative rane protein [Phycisphaerales bacterium]
MTGEALSPTPATEPSDAAPMNRWTWWLTLVALACGACLLAATQWSIVTRWSVPSRTRRMVSFTEWRRLILIGWVLGLAAISAIPLFHRFLLALIRRLRSVSPVGRRWTTLILFVVATAYLVLTAHLQGRDLDMNIQDEMMYLVQAQLIAHGHLYLPAHPMADFFQELFLFHTPVYASMYFPGTALLYATTVWFHIPNWFLAAMVSGAAVAMAYRVVAEMVDGAAGILAALLLVAVGPFRWMSMMVMSHPLAMLQGLLMFWCYLHWRRGGRLGWMALFGALAGWAAITRPTDALAWAVPPFVCIVVELYRRPRAEKVKALALIAVAAAPFLSLQLIFDKGVTGRFLLTPAQAFHERYFPATFHRGAGPAATPDMPAALPQYKFYYDQFILPGAARFRDERLLGRFPFGIVHMLPATWLLFFIPLGIAGLRTRQQWAMAAVFVISVVGSMTFMLFAAHYLVVVAPTGLLMVVLGMRQLERFAGRLGNYAACFLTLCLFVTAIGCLPEFNTGMRDEPSVSTTMQGFNRQVAGMEKPAVVFFHSRPDNPDAWRHEQVFNIDAAWPDDSPVVRAQDLGPRDIELVQYYAQKQPARVFYRYQQESQQLTRLGTTAELLANASRLRPPTTAPTSKPAKGTSDDPD